MTFFWLPLPPLFGKIPENSGLFLLEGFPKYLLPPPDSEAGQQPPVVVTETDHSGVGAHKLVTHIERWELPRHLL